MKRYIELIVRAIAGEALYTEKDLERFAAAVKDFNAGAIDIPLSKYVDEMLEATKIQALEKLDE